MPRLETMNPRNPVTLRHVADEAGVSVTTVSRILNGRETGVPIRDETRQRIVAAAAQLGYRPNLLARALRGSRSSLLGVIVRDIADPFHIQVLRGLNTVARDRHLRARAHEALRHAKPDAAVAAGDERRLAVKIEELHAPIMDYSKSK